MIPDIDRYFQGKKIKDAQLYDIENDTFTPIEIEADKIKDKDKKDLVTEDFDWLIG